MRKTFIAAALLLCSAPGFAQNSELARLRRENEELRRTIELLQADSYDTWATLSDVDYLPSGVSSLDLTGLSPDAKFVLEASPCMDLEYRDVVRNCINRYAVTNRGMLCSALGRYAYHYQSFSTVFARYGIPDELTTLCIVESAVSPTAVSAAGAAGMWQLMPATASQYGLRVDEDVDERFDVQKATEVAARYLRDAYNALGNWPLALMAYNCGVGNVRSAIVRAGSNDPWKVWEYVPAETRAYLPSFLAASYLSVYGEGREDIDIRPYKAVETVRMTAMKEIDLAELERRFQGSRLRELNPVYRNAKVRKGEPFTIRSVDRKLFETIK